MSRSLIVFAASALIVGALFVGYAALVRDPTISETDQTHALENLPPAGEAETAAFEVGSARVPGGSGLELTLFDDRSGRATDRLRVEDWQPVPGSKNEIEVTGPEIALLLPSGMTATISADNGRFTADRVQRKNIRPKFGTLRGNATIVIDRATAPNRAPARERPDDLITIRMDVLDFDLELGQMRTTERVEVRATEFSIAGRGLKLVWNQADNIVDTLLIEHGEELVVAGGSGLFGSLTGQRAADGQPVSPAQVVAAAPESARRPPRIARPKRTAYHCVLTGGVSVRQTRDDVTVGELKADELRLLFDVGGDDGRAAATPTSGPTTRPTDGSDRLVIRWKGSLSLLPEREPARPTGTTARRRLMAIGSPLRLSNDKGTAVCGRLEYYDDTQQIWLQPTPGGRVDFTARDRIQASATSVYVDRRRNVVKLLGQVWLMSCRSPDDLRPFTLECSEWAELVLARSEEDPADPAASLPTDELALGQLQSGTFVGDVSVYMGGQRLTANELQTTFDPYAADDSLEAALQTAMAVGRVRFRDDEQSLECGRLTLEFGSSFDGVVYPRHLQAFGAAKIARGRPLLRDFLGRAIQSVLGVRVVAGPAVVRGERIEADFEPFQRAPAPAPSGAGPLDSGYALRTLAISDRAELRDPENGVAARGDWIVATFADESELTRATVRGSAASPALVYARPYIVRGADIVLDAAAETLHVNGASRLRFPSRRGLQGGERAEAAPVVVRANRSMHVDGRGNTVRFEGDVVAHSAAESLRGDTMTLYLEDVAAPAAARDGRPQFGALQFALGQAYGFVSGEGGRSAGFGPARPKDRALAGGRKEPVRLIANNATITSESFEPGRSDPVAHMSIAAPELAAEIQERIVRTIGKTTLLMTNYRIGGDDAAERAATGLPSALLSRGPSQTAMQADGSMTYVIGKDAPERRDSVLFEGGVFFIHRAGREMVDFETLLPQLQADPELLSQIKSRNTRLRCQRLECEFLTAGPTGAATSGGMAGGGGMRLNLLIAQGEVYLRDVQGAGIRSVVATRAEFDRQRSTVMVSGTDAVDARVYFENPETGEFAEPAVGREFEIDLEKNTINAKGSRGEFIRP